MFSRYFLMFFAVLLVIAVVNVAAQSVEEDDLEIEESSLEIEERSKIGKKIEKILKKFFKKITEVCLKQAVKKCKKYWYNPVKIIQCAKNFFKKENAACLLGASR